MKHLLIGLIILNGITLLYNAVLGLQNYFYNHQIDQLFGDEGKGNPHWTVEFAKEPPRRGYWYKVEMNETKDDWDVKVK